MTKLLMFEVNVKNVTKKGRREGDQLGFEVLILLCFLSSWANKPHS